MRAVDTNIVVRFLTGDDPEQAKRVRALIAGGDIFVSTSVMLESEWVLRGAYGFPVSQVVAGLRGLAGLPGITLEDPALIARAFGWAEQGMDLADALHLGSAEGCDVFVSFDRKLARTAGRVTDIEVMAP